MRLEDDTEAAAWLAGFQSGPEDFEWDAGNLTKSEQKHRVQPYEVESLLTQPFYFAGRIVEPASPEPRWLLLGVSEAGPPPRSHLHPARRTPAPHQLPRYAEQGESAL